jgi:hypothetical protein
MPESEDRSDAPTVELVKDALQEAKELGRLEVALAKEELTRELKSLRVSAIAATVAAACALLGASLLMVALALATGGTLPALILGAVLFVPAAIGVAFAIVHRPTKALEATKRRLEENVEDLKEHVL